MVPAKSFISFLLLILAAEGLGIASGIPAEGFDSSLDTKDDFDIRSLLPDKLQTFLRGDHDKTPTPSHYSASLGSVETPFDFPLEFSSFGGESVFTTVLVEETLTTTPFNSRPPLASHAPPAIPAHTRTSTITATFHPTPTATVRPRPAIWISPSSLKDLNSFGITKYASGNKNIRVVGGIPASASAKAHPTGASSFEEADEALPWDNTTSAIQLFFPAGSVNPGNKPVGGAQFYATPPNVHNLRTARNITLQYSVFFPIDFDWVLGGKLPGMYGGRTGCSGGDAARDCFSTRLMWRKKGAGELYLYAARDQQPLSVCADSQSFCNADYGMSIGRGSFKFLPGRWTTVQQTVVLNTPGKSDGIFVLNVNGRHVLQRNDLVYRVGAIDSGGADAPGGSPILLPPTPTRGDQLPTTSTSSLEPSSTHDGGLLDGLLDGLLGDILGGLFGDSKGSPQAQVLKQEHENLPRPNGRPILNVPTGNNEKGSPSTTPANSFKAKAKAPKKKPATVDKIFSEEPIGFLGIFFSTFFGGHTPEWSTPKDQYIWFKDFALSNND